MKNRRSVPVAPLRAEAGVHATRRGGARTELSARVALRSASGRELDGWVLNISRGGVRVILEESVDPGTDFDVTLLEVDGFDAPQPGRVVWVQEEPDGVIAGIEFRS
ncbi:MAG: PilZ domain-containing protein [Polyangiaceae bacterium]